MCGMQYRRRAMGKGVGVMRSMQSSRASEFEGVQAGRVERKTTRFCGSALAVPTTTRVDIQMNEYWQEIQEDAIRKLGNGGSAVR